MLQHISPEIKGFLNSIVAFIRIFLFQGISFKKTCFKLFGKNNLFYKITEKVTCGEKMSKAPRISKNGPSLQLKVIF